MYIHEDNRNPQAICTAEYLQRTKGCLTEITSDPHDVALGVYAIRSFKLSPKVQSFEPSQLIDHVIRPLSFPS